MALRRTNDGILDTIIGIRYVLIETDSLPDILLGSQNVPHARLHRDPTTFNTAYKRGTVQRKDSMDVVMSLLSI